MIKMKYKYLILMLAILLVLPLMSAETTSLGKFSKDSCIDLIQTCNNCSYVNISSVTYPNSTQALGSAEMTKDGTIYNKSFCKTSILGTYIVNGYGDLDSEITTWSYDFEVAPDYDLTTASSSFYIGIIVVLCFLFIITLAGIKLLPTQDTRDTDGYLISISSLKYFKYPLGALAWGILVIISFVIFNFAEGYMGDGLLVSIFHMFFTLLMISAMIGIPVIFWFMVSKFMQDQVIKRMIERNIYSE